MTHLLCHVPALPLLAFVLVGLIPLAGLTRQPSDHTTPTPIERTNTVTNVNGPTLKIPRPAGAWLDSMMIVGGDPEVGWHSDFCLIKDRVGRWHAIGIGGPDRTDTTMFHAVSHSLKARFAYLPKIGCGPEAPTPKHMWAPFAVWRNATEALLYYCHVAQDGKMELRVLQSQAQDLNKWEPYRGSECDGGNVMLRDAFIRDACVFWDESCEAYRMYYAASSGILMRTSKDLLRWSEPSIVMTAPPNYQAAESPFVLKRDGIYYLWVSGFDYARMSLYASTDPASFGDPVRNRIEEQNGHAPEIVMEAGKDYIACAAINSNFHKPFNAPAASDLNGVYVQQLDWHDATLEQSGRVVSK